MLRFINYNIVFQEVPNEVTLAINISGCLNNCKGCHSPHLMENSGQILDAEIITELINKYKSAINCICFMGGDSDPKEIENLSRFIKEYAKNDIKIAWYSGRNSFPTNCSLSIFNYIKLGPYIEDCGGLNSPSTNQRFYKIENGKMMDNTYKFSKKEVLQNI